MPRTAMTNETGQSPQQSAVSAATTGLRSNMQGLKLNAGQAQERTPVLNPDSQLTSDSNPSSPYFTRRHICIVPTQESGYCCRWY
jgi:hypothetical protein